MTQSSEKFEGWAIVEVMGHKKFAGLVGEQLIAGAALVRVDVPETQHDRRNDGYTIVETKPGYSKFIGPASIYCITPCSEEVARAAARELERWNDPIPVTLPKLIAAGAVRADVVDVDPDLVPDDDDEPIEPGEDDDPYDDDDHGDDHEDTDPPL